MPTLFLLCGLPGSGKTTLALRLEQERHALRLSPDEWMWSLSIDLYDQAKRTAVENLQWDVASRALALGVNVVLENGFWSRAERDDYRSRAKALGASVELCFLDIPATSCGPGSMRVTLNCHLLRRISMRPVWISGGVGLSRRLPMS